MKMNIFILLVLLLGSAPLVQAQHEGHESKVKSEYVGQEHREIKSLSESDIEELKAGKGWGLAKAAELNGVPGPRHVLDMGEQIELTELQQNSIQVIFEAMQAQAIILGNQIVEKERELNTAFLKRDINSDNLRAEVLNLGSLYGELRLLHLDAHLKTIEILSDKQINDYNRLRGYDLADPCKEIPEGHDATLWKAHNNCEG